MPLLHQIQLGVNGKNEQDKNIGRNTKQQNMLMHAVIKKIASIRKIRNPFELKKLTLFFSKSDFSCVDIPRSWGTE